jgi:hypothetical protein
MSFSDKNNKYTYDEMFEIYIGEINDYLPYEYVEKVKNSLQYKEFVKKLEKQESDFIDKLIKQSELDYDLDNQKG